MHLDCNGIIKGTACKSRHSVHETAAIGFAVSVDAYERGRPDYPSEILREFTDVFSLATGRTIVELGAGTGKLTKLLLKTGSRIIAIEPILEMRKTLSASLPDLEILGATAESIPVQDQSVDAVVAGQAFHWFDGTLALAEIYRILTPGGTLGLLWNVKDESIDWVAKLTKIIEPYRGSTPVYYSDQWETGVEFSGFKAFRKKQYWFHHITDKPTALDRVASISFISVLPKHVRHEVLEEVRKLLDAEPITAGKSLIKIPYRTDIYWWLKA